ncbi:MAG: TIGR01212 family radical SAM protein [Prevotellaceae bacterium]|jgi:radical SAM protein (TIGR01212 family)|nr:TIGR01212 family radical SAM protein [Prevotellaceae bacterium]
MVNQKENSIFPWGHQRRFNSYAGYFKRTFGGRVQKVAINAGFTCPNRDGSLARGGCTYCDNGAFNPSYCLPQKSITQQINEGIEFHAAHRYKNAQQYLAYFQAYSNTYAPLNLLRKVYEEALAHPQIIGIIIGTRPDCVDNEKLDYIAEIAQKKYVSVEYGVESCYDKTLLRINRGHNFACAKNAIEATAQRGVNVGAHLIFGLPGETKNDMLREAEILSNLPLHSIKFHQLQIVKNTVLANEFAENLQEFVRFSVPEYIDFFIDFLEKFNPNIVVERFAGEVPPRFLAHSDWGLIRNEQLLAMLDKRLDERDTWQGKIL